MDESSEQSGSVTETDQAVQDDKPAGGETSQNQDVDTSTGEKQDTKEEADKVGRAAEKHEEKRDGEKRDTLTEELETSSLDHPEEDSNDEPQSPKYKYDVDLMIRGFYQDTEVHVDPAAVELLTEGFMNRFMPSLNKAKSSIKQISSSQLVLLETVQQENAKLQDCQAITELEETMIKARHYYNKLLKLRREMTNLHEKSKKLKKRALKLQQQKQKEELTRAHDQEKEFEKERMLTARVASTE